MLTLTKFTSSGEVNTGQMMACTWVGCMLLLALWPPGATWMPRYFQPGFSASLVVLTLAGIYVSVQILKTRFIAFTKVDLAALGFGVYVLIRYLTTPESHWSQGTTMWMVGLALAYVVFRHLAKRVQYEAIWTILIVLALVQCVWGLLQLYDVLPSQHGIFKITGSFFNPAPYSGFLAMLFPLALHRALAGDQVPDWQRKLGWMVAGMILLVVIPARSRAAWLALVAGGGFVLAHHWHLWDRMRQLAIWKKVGLVTVILAILGSGLYGIYRLKPDSADGRLLIWKVSAGMFAEHPVFGRGFARFAPEYMLAQGDYFASGRGSEREEMLAGQVDTAYNEFLQMGVELGAVGLLLFLAVLVVGFRSHSGGRESVPWQAMLIVWMVFAGFSYPGYSWPVALLLILAFVELAKADQPMGRLTRNMPGVVLMVATVAMILAWMWQTQPAVGKWQDGRSAYNYGDYRGALDHYQDAYRALEHEGVFLQQAAKTLQLLGKNAASQSILQWSKNYHNDPFTYSIMGENAIQLEVFDKAADAFLRSSNMIPHRLWSKFLLVRTLHLAGNAGGCQELAIELLQQIQISKVGSRAIDSEILAELTFYARLGSYF